MYLLPALAGAIGWGIRGNFGHEHGAMIHGTLVGLAIVIVSGRPDWWRRAAYFAAFSAIGWSFGGSMSYGKVLAYTHSRDSWTVLYGFASLFVIGFLWAAMGGAGTALCALLDRKRLTEFFPPLIVMFGVWIVHDLTYDALNIWVGSVLTGTAVAHSPAFRHEDPLYWYDTDWTTAALTVVTMLAYAAVTRKMTRACSLILHMAVGWWIAFLGLVVLLGLRMTPPRGDSWAGCVGMAAGMFVFFRRNRLGPATYASLVCGLIGGLGFSGGQTIKLMWIATGWETNWHSVLEQTYGAINGLAAAVPMLFLSRRLPKVSEEPPETRRWTEWTAFLIAIPFVAYINLRKCVETWIESKAVPETLYGLPPITWFNLAYLAVAIALVWPLLRHTKRPLPFLPSSWLGRAQLMFFIFLWWIAIGNFERALVGFQDQRLVTEGVIYLNAAIATLLAAVCYRSASEDELPDDEVSITSAARIWLWKGGAACLIALVCMWGVKRTLFGDTFVKHGGQEIRFGPNATIYDKPRPGQAHP